MECAAKDREGMVGLVFGAGFSGQKVVVIDLDRGLMFLAKTDEGLELEKSITRVSKRKLDEFVMGIEVAADGHVGFFLEGEKVGEHDFEVGELQGGVGIIGGGEDVVFRDFRVKY